MSPIKEQQRFRTLPCLREATAKQGAKASAYADDRFCSSLLSDHGNCQRRIFFCILKNDISIISNRLSQNGPDSTDIACRGQQIRFFSIVI